MRFVCCCLLFALPAAAQLDSYTLRAKYGAPLNRETFHTPQGFDMAVDYGAGNQVCKITVPVEMPLQPNVSGGFNPRQQMQDFLADLLPASMRGKEIRRMMFQSGLASVSTTEYEHVTIVEPHNGGASPQGETITVRFMDADCPSEAVQ
jgi:hypothetical protein